MNSSDRTWAAFFITLGAVIVSVAYIISVVAATPIAVQKMKIQSEHILKRECIRNKGEWKYVYNSGDTACSFVKEKD